MKKYLVTVVTVVAVLALGLRATAGEKVLRIAHGASESFHVHRAMVKFKEEVEKSGKFQAQIYPSSQFGNDTEMIESVLTGDLNMAVSPTSFLTNEVPAMSLIELPYLFPSREVALEVLDGPWGQAQLDKLHDAGLHGLGYFESGMRHITNSRREIRRPEDLKGLKFRTMQVPAHVDYWNSVGCSAEGSPFPELYTNLSTKVFDGQENPIAHIYSQKFYEVQPYLTLSGHVFSAYSPLMNVDYWNGLSPEEQKILADAFKAAAKYDQEIIKGEEAKQLDEIENSAVYSTKVTRLTPEELQAFLDSAKPTLEKYRKIAGEEVFDGLKQAIDKSWADQQKKK